MASNNFKHQVAQQRAAIPQVDPESAKSLIPAPIQTIEPQQATVPPIPNAAQTPAALPEPIQQAQASAPTHRISDAPANRGFFMYPSRHRQIAKDLAYIEDRKPWQIIEDALEEYVVRHYGKEYKRK